MFGKGYGCFLRGTSVPLKDLIWIHAIPFLKADVLGSTDWLFLCSRICPSPVKASHLI